MAVEHASLTGSSLHESKGVDTALINEVFVTDGAGSGAFGQVPIEALEDVAKAFQTQLIHVREKNNSNSQTSVLASGVWNSRTLNNTVVNGITGASLAANQVTLPQGTYFVIARAPAFGTNGHKAKLYNVTDGSDQLIGSTSYSTAAGAYVTSDSWVFGTFTIASGKVFELRHMVSSTGRVDYQNNFGVDEVYSDLLIWKIG